MPKYPPLAEVLGKPEYPPLKEALSSKYPPLQQALSAPAVRESLEEKLPEWLSKSKAGQEAFTKAQFGQVKKTATASERKGRVAEYPGKIKEQIEEMKGAAKGPLAGRLRGELEEMEAEAPFMEQFRKPPSFEKSFRAALKPPEGEKKTSQRKIPSFMYKKPEQIAENIKRLQTELETASTPEERQRIKRELGEWEKAKPLGMTPTQAAFTGMDVVLGAPFRVVAGAAKSAKDWLQYATTPEWLKKAHGREAPEAPWSTVWKSLKYEKPVYMGDVYVEALEESLARKLTEGERIAAKGFGLFTEIFGPGQATKVFRLGRGKPGFQAVAKKAEKALAPEGIKAVGKAPMKKKFLWGVKPTPEKMLGPEAQAISRHELERLGHSVMEAKTHPARVQTFLDQIRAIGKNLGLDEAAISQAERKAIQLMGKEGVRLEKSGVTLARPLSKKQALREQIGELKRKGEIPEEVVPGLPARMVRIGAKRTGVSKIPGVGEAFYGAGAAPGYAEAVRPAGAFKLLSGEEAIEAGKQIEKGLGSAERSIEISRIKDMQYNLGIRDRLAKRVAESQDDVERAFLQGQLDDANEGFKLALKRSGLTEAEVQAGYIAKTPEEAQLVRQAEESLNDMRKLELSLGAQEGEIENYVFRSLTPEAKELRRTVLGKKAGKQTEKFLKERSGETSVSIAGTRNVEFVERFGQWYAARKQAHAIWVSNRMAEQSILKNYGRAITDDMARVRGRFNAKELMNDMGFQRELKSRGLEVYFSKTGAQKDIPYILDSGTAKNLDRMLNPKNYGKVVKAWVKYHNWWKGRATILRPGFVMRNVFGGNIWQLWEADVDLIPALYDGIRAVKYINKKNPLADPITKTVLDQVEKNAAKTTSGLGKYGRYKSFEDAVEAGRPYGLSRTGFFGAEIGEQGRAGTWLQAMNPMSKHFIVSRINKRFNTAGEDAAKWACYLDRIKKGYTAAEAAAEAGKYVFFYHELAPLLQMGKHFIPFITWNWKNWGMQIATLLNKPDKFFNFGRLYYGIQGMDPISPEEQKNLPEWSSTMMPFFVPGARGKEEGERLWFVGAGIFPMTSLAQLEPSRIPATIGEMMNPIIRSAFEAVGKAAEEERPPYWGTHPRQKGAMLRVPTWIDKVMNYAREKSPKAYNMLSAAFQIDPTIDFATGISTGHKWPSAVADFFQMVDPGFATLNRIFRHDDERMYDALLSTATGLKLYGYTKERQEQYKEQKMKSFWDKLMEKHKKYRSLGAVPPSESYPFPNF